jgi:hypothetical protein
MFKIKAKFIGKNSVGFVNSNIYYLVMISMPHIGKGMIEITTEFCVSLQQNKLMTINPRLRCEYGSWEKFIPNWEILHFENMSGDHDAEIHHTKVNSGLKQSVRDSKINKVLS